MTWTSVRVLTVILLEKLNLRGETGDLGLCLGKSRLLALRTHVQAFSVNEFHIGHAEEAQEVAHVAGLRVHRGPLIDASASREHVHFLPGEFAHGTLLGVLEGYA